MRAVALAIALTSLVPAAEACPERDYTRVRGVPGRPDREGASLLVPPFPSFFVHYGDDDEVTFRTSDGLPIPFRQVELYGLRNVVRVDLDVAEGAIIVETPDEQIQYTIDPAVRPRTRHVDDSSSEELSIDSDAVAFRIDGPTPSVELNDEKLYLNAAEPQKAIFRC